MEVCCGREEGADCKISDIREESSRVALRLGSTTSGRESLDWSFAPMDNAICPHNPARTLRVHARHNPYLAGRLLLLIRGRRESAIGPAPCLPNDLSGRPDGRVQSQVLSPYRSNGRAGSPCAGTDRQSDRIRSRSPPNSGWGCRCSCIPTRKSMRGRWPWACRCRSRVGSSFMARRKAPAMLKLACFCNGLCRIRRRRNWSLLM